MGDEHLDTILETESDEFKKSSVENLVLNPNPHHFNAESDLIESLLNHDSSIISSSSKIDSLFDEFTGELTLLKSIPPGIKETDCNPEEEIRFTKRLLYNNSSPHPPKEFISENSDTAFESFSPSPILVEDSDSLIKEIDLFFTLDDRMPPGIEEDDMTLKGIFSHLKNCLAVIPFHFLKMSHFILIFLHPFVLLQNHRMPSAECPMMIYGKNNLIWDVLFSISIPLDKFKYGNWVKLSDPKQALRGRHPMLILSLKITVNHLIFNTQNDLFDSQTKLMEQLTSMYDMVGQFIQKNEEEKQIEEDQAANALYWKIPACYDGDDDDYAFAITPNEPYNSLSMGDEHLDTISVMESDEFMKSSVENLVPILSESEGESEYDMPICEEFTTFLNILFYSNYDFYSSDDQSFFDEDLPKEIYSNPLFDEEIIPMKIDQHHYNAESDLIESLRIDETDCYPEEETHFTKRLLYDNPSPRQAEEIVSDNSDTEIESFSPSPIPIKDSDSPMEEIDLSFTPDYPMPPGIEDNDYDSERDILILKDLLSNDTLSLLENESFHFDIPSSSRPPAKPPDGNTGILNVKMMGEIFEHK
nr:hypothetical protein [Tanacetum cinerariifolium]